MPRMTPKEERELVERIVRGDEDPDTWEELPPLESDAPQPSKRLGAVLSVRLDPDLAEALSREAERRSRVSGTTIGHTTLAAVDRRGAATPNDACHRRAETRPGRQCARAAGHAR